MVREFVWPLLCKTFLSFVRFRTLATARKGEVKKHEEAIPYLQEASLEVCEECTSFRSVCYHVLARCLLEKGKTNEAVTTHSRMLPQNQVNGVFVGPHRGSWFTIDSALISRTNVVTAT
mmetsp:Transcript_66074/g.137708  ORF Transcript_66074/g.137708 Transcript_66074/m.137708 type:complete len:119 (+) Transcript_66074:485-841(+)